MGPLSCLLVLAVAWPAFGQGEGGNEVEAGEEVLEKFTRKGKLVTREEGTGDIAVELRRKRWENEKGRSLCCALAGHHCKGPCSGSSCTAQCTVRCGFLAFWKCSPMTCQSANPGQCTASSTCNAGAGTQVGTKCFTLNPGPVTWLAALTTCIMAGGTLAKIESAAEQAAAVTLAGGVNTWIGLNDIGAEGAFEWADGAALGAYTSWSTAGGGQPTSTATVASIQHCVILRAVDGDWNDVRCSTVRPFICQT